MEGDAWSGALPGMPELPPASRDPGEQRGCHTDPLLPASGHSRLLEKAFAEKERGRRWLGRQLGQGQAGRGSRASATPASPSSPDPTRAHARPLALPPSLPVQIPSAAPMLPFLLGGGTSSTWIELCLYTHHSGYLYIQGAR